MVSPVVAFALVFAGAAALIIAAVHWAEARTARRWAEEMEARGRVSAAIRDSSPLYMGSKAGR